MLHAPMSGLVACPFCREMFERGEAAECPHCGLRLASLSNLPPSYEASLEEAVEADGAEEPGHEPLPWGYMGRGRGALVGVAMLGMALFFAPWVHELAPEDRVMSGFDLARRLSWMWAPAVAWGVMIPLVLSRRSIHAMRGARVAVAFLAAIAAVTVALRLAFAPASTALRPVRIEWAWPLYATGALAVCAIALAVRFGGALPPAPRDPASAGRP